MATSWAERYLRPLKAARSATGIAERGLNLRRISRTMRPKRKGAAAKCYIQVRVL